MSEKHSKFAPLYITKEGFNKLKKELDFLVRKKRIEVAEKIHEARGAGGVVDDTSFEAAREEQGFIEGRISELEEILAKSKIVEKNQKMPFVVIGSNVVVEAGGKKDSFTIVGAAEANPLERKISNESPVGRALLGARVGDSVEVSTPVIRTFYKIIEIK